MLGQAFSKHFKKDYALAERQHKPMAKIAEVMGMLINEKPLPHRCHEHLLHGTYEGCTERPTGNGTVGSTTPMAMPPSVPLYANAGCPC
jgi:mRNA-degrading endonuclease YafQ of YafQ-DinJ toxin-antitoxin module